MRLKPEEVQLVNAMRSIKGAGKVDFTKAESGRITIEIKPQHQKVKPTEGGQGRIGNLRG